MKKFLKYIFFIFIFSVTVTVALTYIYKDKIIHHFIEQMNSQLNTPITVEDIDISVLDQLPYISVVLHGVQMQESYQGSKQTLLKADQIACALNPLDILTGDYSVQALSLKNADIRLKVNQYNTPNYLVFKKSDTTTSAGAVLDIKSVTLENSTVSYQNEYGNKHISFVTKKMKSSLQIYGKIYHIKSKGDVQVTSLLINNQSYLEGISLTIDSDLLYNQHLRTIEINPSTVTHQGSVFDLSGKYGLDDNQLLLSLASNETNLTALKDLVPDRYLANLNPYQYTGEVSFQLSLNGLIKKGMLPPAQLVFTLSNASLIDPKHHSQIDNMSLSGYYQNAPKDSLALTEITGELNQLPFTSRLLLDDFKSPRIDLTFDGAISGSTLQHWAELSQVDSISGEIALDFAIVGKISDFKSKKTIPNIRATGDVTIAGLDILLKNKVYQFKQLNGGFIFNNNDLAISGFSGMINENDFELTGLIKNFLGFTMLDNQPLGIEADFRANYINLDQLLARGGVEQATDQSYHFSISPQLYLKLNCDIGRLQFRRFDGYNIKGNLTVSHQIASSEAIKINTMGGSIKLSGKVNAQSDSIFITSSTDLSRIHIDSLFYVFENFNQQFLVDKNLKGMVNAHIENQISFDHSLLVNPSSIIADISTTIIGGELNNFEPMQKLSKYLDGDKLDRLRFAELANDIHVENQTIYLPSMQINSNVSNITIGGTHTFDQHIHYNVVAPLNNRTKIDKDAAFGAIETSNTGKTKIFLKITGTTSDYDISYDKSALKKEVISDLKREVRQLKEAFRKKGEKEQEEVELEEEDYFDWE